MLFLVFFLKNHLPSYTKSSSKPIIFFVFFFHQVFLVCIQPKRITMFKRPVKAATGFHRKVLTLDKISDLSRSTAGMKVPGDIREDETDGWMMKSS